MSAEEDAYQAIDDALCDIRYRAMVLSQAGLPATSD